MGAVAGWLDEGSVIPLLAAWLVTLVLYSIYFYRWGHDNGRREALRELADRRDAEPVIVTHDGRIVVDLGRLAVMRARATKDAGRN